LTLKTYSGATIATLGANSWVEYFWNGSAWALLNTG
jgi:hypothetical protein